MGRALTGTVTTEGGTPVAYWRSGKGPPLVGEGVDVLLIGGLGDTVE